MKMLRSHKSLLCDRPRNLRKRRQLRFQLLDSRRLLTVAEVFTTFRDEDFSIAGSFQYSLVDIDAYRDSIPNGSYASESGHMTWASPIDGNGVFAGTATGEGSDSFQVGGQRRACSSYGIEDSGSFGFSINAQEQSLRIDDNNLTSTRYTHYSDLTNGFCPQPDPPWSRFFGGEADFYVGSFDPATSTATIDYDLDDGTNKISISTSPAVVQWANNGPTDVILTVNNPVQELELPPDWIFLEQTSDPSDEDYIDLTLGIDLSIEVTGKPMAPLADVSLPVAPVKLYWTQAANDATTEEISIDSMGETMGLFWNSQTLSMSIRDFPEKPFWANYVKVEVDAPQTDANFANNSVYLTIVSFDAEDSISPELTEDMILDGRLGSILGLGDSLDPDVAAYAYSPTSVWGAAVYVGSDKGEFLYDPTHAPEIQALAPGEKVDDAMYFVAIKYQTLKSYGAYVVPLIGVNDLPFAISDEAATTNDTAIDVAPLQNDYDIDNGDSVVMNSVDETSDLGATLTLLPSGIVVYNPTNAEALQALAKDEEILDSFSYEIIDTYGGKKSGTVEVLVTGVEKNIGKPTIVIFPYKPIRMNTTTNALPFTISQPNADLDAIQVTISSDAPDLFPEGSFALSGSGSDRSLTATPASNQSGHALLTILATDPLGNLGEATIDIVVGTLDDLDLDGVDDQTEDNSPNAGDLNFDGTPDSEQPNIASTNAWGSSTTYVSLSTDSKAYFSSVTNLAAPASTGVASDALFPFGLVQFQLVQAPNGTKNVVMLRYSDDTMAINGAFFHSSDSNAPEWQRYMRNRIDGAAIYSDRVEVELTDGGRTDDDQTQDGAIQATIGLASVTRPWTNTFAYDVNNDGIVQPIDALIVINDLNRKGIRDLSTRLQGSEQLPNFIDVSGDQKAAPIDALLIINYLNRQLGVKEAEGEFQPSEWNTTGEPSLDPSSLLAGPATRPALFDFGPQENELVRRRLLHDAVIRQWSANNRKS